MRGPLDLEIEKAPPDGVWRVGRTPDPLSLADPLTMADLDDPRIGNRFDSALGQYSTLYFGTDLECCFGETLARFRPDPVLLANVDDWSEDLMGIGSVPADWRQKRVAVRVEVPPTAIFVDVESAQTRKVLRVQIAPALALFGGASLDVSTIRGGDRRVTRAVSQWVFDYARTNELPIAGIRYLSRLDSKWETWAVFGHVPLEERERHTIRTSMPALQHVSQLFDLTVH
jgi:hypothetical protein